MPLSTRRVKKRAGLKIRKVARAITHTFRPKISTLVEVFDEKLNHLNEINKEMMHVRESKQAGKEKALQTLSLRMDEIREKLYRDAENLVVRRAANSIGATPAQRAQLFESLEHMEKVFDAQKRPNSMEYYIAHRNLGKKELEAERSIGMVKYLLFHRRYLKQSSYIQEWLHREIMRRLGTPTQKLEYALFGK